MIPATFLFQRAVRPSFGGAARTMAAAAALALTITSGLLLGRRDLTAQDLVLVNANVVDVEAGRVQEGVTVTVRDGKIASIGTESVHAGAGVRVIDVGGMYLSPGLLDGHVHVSNPDQARRALGSGVTTARSMGTSNYADVGLRELAAGGFIDSPEILAAGYHVRPRPATALFMDHPALANFMEGGIQGPEAINAMVEAVLDEDVDFIKTTSTERAGLPQTDPRKQLYSEAELRVMVEAAARRGIGVAAHAHGEAGGRAAVVAGVRSIEHGTYLSPETLGIMAERGTYLVPTMAIVADLTIPGGDYDNAGLQIRGRHMLPRIRETVRNAHQAGVKIVAATDTGYGPDGTVRMGHELLELVGIGMTPLEALRSATTVAAELLGVDDHTGRIAVGLDADLIVTERNPLEDIGTVQDVLLVVNDGKVVVTRGDWFEGSGQRAVSQESASGR